MLNVMHFVEVFDVLCGDLVLGSGHVEVSNVVQCKKTDEGIKRQTTYLCYAGHENYV